VIQSRTSAGSPPPNAEALGGEQAAQIGAADRLFVAANERGDLECREEAVGERTGR
jgi:hypothetical protein